MVMENKRLAFVKITKQFCGASRKNRRKLVLVEIERNNKEVVLAICEVMDQIPNNKPHESLINYARQTWT